MAVKWARRFVQRRLRPFDHLTFHDVADMQAHSPHVLQIWKRWRYRQHLLRVYKPKNDVERVAFEKQLKKLQPQPIAVFTVGTLAYLYGYPCCLAVAMLCGFTRGPLGWLIAPGSVQLPAEITEETAVDPEVRLAVRVERAVERSAAVQVNGAEGSRIVQIVAASLPRRTLYIAPRHTDLAKPLEGEAYPAAIVASYYGLTAMQVRCLFQVLNAFYVKPVVVLDVASRQLDEWQMRRDSAFAARRDKTFDVVYTNDDPRSTTYLLTQEIIDRGFVALLTDVLDPRKGARGGDPDLVTELAELGAPPRAARTTVAAAHPGV